MGDAERPSVQDPGREGTVIPPAPSAASLLVFAPDPQGSAPPVALAPSPSKPKSLLSALGGDPRERA